MRQGDVEADGGGADVVRAAIGRPMMPGPPPVAMTLSRGRPTSPRMAPPRSEAMRPKARASAYQRAWFGLVSSPTRALPKTTMVERTPQACNAASAFWYSMRKRTPRMPSLSRKS
jgi:hypothetical protein